MNWKGRQMFSDREHGIVSGLSPVNMTNGGSVSYPSYLTGGQITGGQTPPMPMELFNEGDQDINMALNSMVGTTSPSMGKLSEEVAVADEPMVEEPRTMDYETELFELKQDFYDDIMSYISQVQDMEQVEKYLKGIRIAYGEQLKKLKRKYNVADYMAEEELLTPDFLTEIQQVLSNEDALPGLEHGGLHITTQDELDDLGINLTLEQWNSYDQDKKDRHIEAFLIRKAGTTKQAGTGYDMTRLDAALERARTNAKAIGTAAKARKTAIDELYKKRLTTEQIRAIGTQAGAQAVTKGGGFGSFLAQSAAAGAAEAAAKDLVYQDMMKNYPESQTAAEAKAMSDILTREISAEQYLASAGLRGADSTTPKMTAEMQNFMLKGRDLPIQAKTIFDAGTKLSNAEFDGDPNVVIAYMMGYGRFEDIKKSFPNFAGERMYNDQAMDFQTYLNTIKKELAERNVVGQYAVYGALSVAIAEWGVLPAPLT